MKVKFKSNTHAGIMPVMLKCNYWSGVMSRCSGEDWKLLTPENYDRTCFHIEAL